MAAVAGEVTAPLHRRRLRQGRSRLTRIPPIIWVFLGLGTVMEAFWVAWPTLNTFYYSFTQWDGIGKKVWVGLGNYRGLLHDPVFGKALLDNCIWVVGFGGLSLSFGLIFRSGPGQATAGSGGVPSTHISSVGIFARRDGAVLADVLQAVGAAGQRLGSDRAAEEWSSSG